MGKRKLDEAENEGMGDSGGEATQAELEELEKARQEAAANWDRYLRAEAELDNTRKRLERAHAERLEEERRRLLCRALAIKDDLERALSYEGPEENLREGVELIDRQFDKLLDEEGVERIQAVGEEFDPMLHEAVAVVPTEGAEGMVVDEIQGGYVCRGRLLRPCRVTVSKGPRG